jgi:hypothetical protein
MTLADLFRQSRGRPIEFNGQTVVLMDRIPIKRGKVCLELLGERRNPDCGIALESSKGAIQLSDGKKVRLLHTWDDPRLPRNVEHEVRCPDGELKVWNIYRTRHSSGLVTVDAWTGNAGMLVKRINDNCREYACSSGPGEFDPSELVVRICWVDMPPDTTRRSNRRAT